jgi:hypothetical protein
MEILMFFLGIQHETQVAYAKETRKVFYKIMYY